MRKRLLAALSLLPLLAADARAISSEAGTAGAAFLGLGFGSARAMAMGRSLVALADGTDALTWNPAGLALAQTREFSYSYLRHVQGVEAPVYMAYVHPAGRTVFGGNVAYMNVDGFDVRDEAGRPRNNSDVQVRNGFVTFSAARSFLYEKLFLGASLKGIQEDNAGARRSSVVGDLGAVFKPSMGTSVGFSTQNLGANKERVGSITRLGGAVQVLELLGVTLELSKPSDNGWNLGFGGEFVLPEEFLSVGQIALRAGYYSTGDQGTVLQQNRHPLYPLVGAKGLSFGIGLFSSQALGYGFGLDYALIPLGALGNADILSLRIRF